MTPPERRMILIASVAFAVAALGGDGESVIHGAEAASVSFPEFWETLGRITAG